VLAVLFTLTWRRAHVYEDAEVLWRDTLQKNPGAFIASDNLGALLLARGELGAAAKLFEDALRAKPDHAEGLDNLGLISQRQGKLDEAVTYFRDALRCDPNFPNAHNNLGTVLAQQGRSAEALEHFDAAVRLRPSFAKAQQNRGIVLERLGRSSDAVAAYRETLRFDPGAREVEKRVAWILATDPDPAVRNGVEAVRLAQAASLAAGGNDPLALDVLAAAFAEAGRFDDAVRTAERALQLAAPPAADGAREAAEARLALYRAGRPFRRVAE
jgi:spermidine synthase